MKANIKKLVLLMTITLIATFMMAATVTADPPGNRSIRGVYAATGSGTCLIAPLGFTNFVPNGGLYMTMTFTMEGVFTFYGDGTGHIERPHAPVVIHNSSLGVPFPSAGDSKDSSDFTYKVEGGGKVTLTQVPGSHSGEFTDGPLKGFIYHNENRNWWGTVSPDGKTITLNSGFPDIITSPSSEPEEGLICNGSAVLIWQHN
jgi:hypothetical protein